MAYAAVVSLLQTLEQLLQSDVDPQFSFPYPKPQVQALNDQLVALQSSLEKIHPVRKSLRQGVNALEIKIRDAIYKAQDTVESFISSQYADLKDDYPSANNFLQDLQGIIAELEPVTEKAAEKAKEVQKSIKGRKKGRKTGEEHSENPPSIKSAPTRKIEIVGQEEDRKMVMGQIITDTSKELQVIPIIGMPGIGKTTLARSIYELQGIKSHFDARAWVTVSQDYNVPDIFSRLMRSFAHKNEESDMSGFTDKPGEDDSQRNDLSDRLHKRLFNKKFLIVIDDMWETDIWDKVKRYFPDNGKGSRIVLTTRLADVADKAKTSSFFWKMNLLDTGDSWKLLCQNAFLEGVCPSLLEPTGREIAKNCGGLPLSLTVVGGLLYKEEKSLDYWKIIAEDTTAAAGDQSYKEILSLSYNHLPSRLKGCFLYMGAFRKDSEILVSKLVQLWVAEGLPTPPSWMFSSNRSLEQIADSYLQDLIDRNLISAREKTSHGHTKSCSMHDALRDLAVEESAKESFFHSIYRYRKEDHPKSRRVSVHKNILICMEEIYESAKSIKAPRSLLYVGTHHHHAMPFVLTFDLLKVLDALTVYFISFPTEILKLIHLRYLSMTYNGQIPESVSELRNLQALIVRRHPKILLLCTSFMPLQIWNMPQLRHILFTETRLPDLSDVLSQNTPPLENLQTLSNVRAACLTDQVLERIPNLTKLEVWIDEPDALDLNLEELKRLESFKFTVVNPFSEPERNSLIKLNFPETLTKLTLSGCGIPWEYMEVIAELPNLQVLKLRELACKGQTWKPKGIFYELKFLLLDALDFKNWEADETCFPALERLIIRHCYELETMPSNIRLIGPIQWIEVVDCSPKAVEWAKTIREELQDPEGDHDDAQVEVRYRSSWE